MMEIVPVNSDQCCARCGGNMFPGEDLYTRFMACLQCGTRVELPKDGTLDDELEAILRPQRARFGLTPKRAVTVG